MNHNPVYLLLAGLPAAGKSTLSAQIYDLWRKPKPIVLSTDDYIETVASGKCSTYSAEFQANIKAAESYVARLREGSLRAGADIIHDQTNLSVKSRAKRISGVLKTYLKVCLVVGASEEARQARLLNRPRKVIPADVDAQMCASWQDPTFDEGWDDILYDWNWETGLFSFLRSLKTTA